MRVQNITTPYLWAGIRRISHGMQHFGEWKQISSEKQAEVINTIHFVFQRKEFVVKYFKIIVVVLSFSLTLYIQHVNNTAQIAELETKCIGLEVEIKNQYDRINAMKLDKSVFEATMMQLNTVQNDLHEIRADIRELLKCQNLHK